MERHELAVVAAIAAVGYDAECGARWRAKVNQMLPDVAAMLDDSKQLAVAKAMLDEETKRFPTYYGGYTLEESSTRLVVAFLNEDGTPQMSTFRGKSHPETVRTLRTDEAGGKLQMQRLDRLEVGQRIFVYLHHEHTSSDSKVRVLLHVAPIGPAPSGTGTPSRPPERAGPPPDEPPPPPPDPADEEPPPVADNFDYDAWRAQMRDKLTDHQYFLVARDLEDRHQIDIAKIATPAELEIARVVARRIFRTVPEDEEPF